MQFANDVVDYGDAIETHVSGIASINKISEHMVRVTFYTQKGAAGGVGEIEKRVTIHLVWDMANWLLSQANVHQAMGAFVSEVLMRGQEGMSH